MTNPKPKYAATKMKKQAAKKLAKKLFKITKKVAKFVARHPVTKVADKLTNLLLKLTALSLMAVMAVNLASYIATPALENLSDLAGINPGYALAAFNVAGLVALLVAMVKLAPATLRAVVRCFDELD